MLGELAFPPRVPGEPIPPAVAVSKFLTWMSGHPLLPDKMTLAIQSFHWTFSLAVGAAYGVIAEFFPRARFGCGAGFGIVLQLLTHESALPYFGLSLPWTQIPAKEHLSELCTHVVYGVTVELCRRFVRGRLLGPSLADGVLARELNPAG